MNLNGTLKVIVETANSLDAGALIAVVVAALSLLGVVISTCLTNKTTKKISRSNEKLQEKWNQKNIDIML